VLLDFMMNDEIDKPISNWDETFLPMELEALLARAKYVDAQGNSIPVVAEEMAYYRSTTRKPVPATPPSYAGWMLLMGLAAGGSALGLAYWFQRTRKRLPRVLLGLQNAFTG